MRGGEWDRAGERALIWGRRVPSASADAGVGRRRPKFLSNFRQLTVFTRACSAGLLGTRPWSRTDSPDTSGKRPSCRPVPHESEYAQLSDAVPERGVIEMKKAAGAGARRGLPEITQGPVPLTTGRPGRPAPPGGHPSNESDSEIQPQVLAA